MRQLKIQKSITNRSSEALDKYLVEIGRAPLISIDEEIELAQKIKKGGPEGEKAKDKLVTANLRFVVSVAKQYQHQGLTLTDLIDEGNIGLIKAAQKFDETRGFKFISYAVWWIRQSILQAIAEQSRIVRLPLNQVGSLNKINHEINKFEQETGEKISKYCREGVNVADRYEMTATVDAWDRSLGETNPLLNNIPYPAQADVSNTGMVYYIMSPGELDYSNPVDQSDYQAWLNSQLGGGQEQSIAWQNITAANIQALRSGS